MNEITNAQFRDAVEESGLTNAECAALLKCSIRAVAYWKSTNGAPSRPVDPLRYEVLQNYIRARKKLVARVVKPITDSRKDR